MSIIICNNVHQTGALISLVPLRLQRYTVGLVLQVP